MRTSFTYLADSVIEFVIDGDDMRVNVLPLPSVEAPQPILAPPLEEAVPCIVEPPLTKKRRSLMGIIRSGWFVVFTAAGESLTYALNNLTTLNLPPGTATAIGAVGYGIKRAAWPNTTL